MRCSGRGPPRDRSALHRGRRREDVATAVATIIETEPDVVLLDVHLPGGGGAEVIKQVLPVKPEVKFLALSVSDAAQDVIGVIRAGARGYVTKSISSEELIEGMTRVAGGDAVFSPRLAGSCWTPSPVPWTCHPSMRISTS
nr:response regulator transcription factor [Tessaracoccus coleopterorum]